jgi:hypothetical protein
MKRFLAWIKREIVEFLEDLIPLIKKIITVIWCLYVLYHWV